MPHTGVSKCSVHVKHNHLMTTVNRCCREGLSQRTTQ